MQDDGELITLWDGNRTVFEELQEIQAGKRDDRMNGLAKAEDSMKSGEDDGTGLDRDAGESELVDVEMS